MEDIEPMEGSESKEQLNSHFPYFLFCNPLLFSLMILDIGAQISLTGELGDQYERLFIFVIESFPVGEDIGVGDAG